MDAMQPAQQILPVSRRRHIRQRRKPMRSREHPSLTSK